MERKTRVNSMEIKTKRRFTPAETLTEPIELPVSSKRWNVRFCQADRLMRNLAVVGALLLVVVAMRNSPSPEAQSVFSALQESAGMEWDETVGKLSFVNSILPESIQSVWNPSEAITVYAPVRGETLHAWTRSEPYITLQSSTADVRAAADGEVMSIAHGLSEERIMRIRHDDESEALYGNLAYCNAEIGQRVYAGDVIAQLIKDQPLAFELRIGGRSVDPTDKLLPFEE